AKSIELQAVFDSIADGLVIYDHRGTVQHRNHVCPRLFPVHTLPGRSCRELFHPEVLISPKLCPVERALLGERVETSLTSNDGGRTRYFDTTATPIEDPQGETNRVLLFVRDVTEKRVQELQLLQAEKLSSLGVLAAGVAHEINNPLTSVAGYAEALMRRFRDDSTLKSDPRLDEFPRYLEVIVREAYRCKGIIDSLLSFSRKSDGSFGSVDLNGIITEVMELVRHKSRYEQIELKTALQPDLPPVNGDPAGIRQVCMNLLINAHQAIEGPGTVEIITSEEGAGMVSIEIHDTGCGIPKDAIDQIWDPFYTTKAVGEGLGLGLALTYNIVKRHSGEISVKSTLGKGSTFTVRLPACQ
ncbi:MAG TPA: ATP-binding protein, partial [Verrucomicrobiae bacterium]|nr:ATP-binding protein [Verrucomicrobiae bacterium]